MDRIELPSGNTIDGETWAALDALASVMLVQAEDGLYTLGSPDAEGDVENEFLGHFIAADVVVC